MKLGLRTRRTLIPGHEAEGRPQTLTQSERQMCQVYADHPEQLLKLLVYIYKVPHCRRGYARAVRSRTELPSRAELPSRDRQGPVRATPAARKNPEWLMAPFTDTRESPKTPPSAAESLKTCSNAGAFWLPPLPLVASISPSDTKAKPCNHLGFVCPNQKAAPQALPKSIYPRTGSVCNSFTRI